MCARSLHAEGRPGIDYWQHASCSSVCLAIGKPDPRQYKPPAPLAVDHARAHFATGTSHFAHERG